MNILNRSQVALSAFVAFILLFAALMGGYEFYSAGREKAGQGVWTGSQAGVAITSFLQGADAKAVKSKANPNPEVFAATRWLNQHLFSQHTAFFSWMVVLGELLLGVAIVALLLVKFPYSRLLLLVFATLAAVMNFLYLSEGVSSTNPPMAFMWLAIVWVVALMPAVGLFYAVDAKALLGRGATTYPQAGLAASLGTWAFFAAVFAVIVAGSLAMYWDALGTWTILAVVSVVLAAGAYELRTRVLRQRISRGLQAGTLPHPATH